MSSHKRFFPRSLAVLLASSLSGVTALTSYAAEPPAADLSALAAASANLNASGPSATVSLINRLTERGVLNSEDSTELLALAEADAAEARAQAAFAQAALAQAVAAQARARALAYQNGNRRSLTAANRPLAAGRPPQAPTNETPFPAPRASGNPALDADPTLPEVEPPIAAKTPRRALPIAPEVPDAVAEAEPPADLAIEPARPVAPRPRAHAAKRPEPKPLDALPPEEDMPPPAADEVRVSYVPEYVKAQLREEIKQEVMATARKENWAEPRLMPEWVPSWRLFADFRFRGESLMYPQTNATGQGSSFWNYNAINTSATPFDYTGLTNPPFANADQDRNRLRIRARAGAEVDLSDGFSLGLRIGTGENNSPVTQNQSLGAAGSGQGGNFSKYALWLDRAFLKYELWGLPDKDLTLGFGRFDNPFFATNMIWSDDIGFDGFYGKWKFSAGDALSPFLTAGVFPVYNTDLNFGTTNPTKFKSNDKWLMGAQLGTSLEVSAEINFKIGLAYYDFVNVEGRVSDPFTPVTAQDSGNTDASRPAFAQRGNTYVALRNILLDASNSGTSGVTNQWQYFGLATPFHEAAVTAQLDFNQFEPFQISLIGEYVKNLAFDQAAILQNGPARLKGPTNNNASDGSTFGGSGSAWNVTLKAGQAALLKRWDWNATLSYRHVGSDAVVDGFTDSDFGGGGTNLKGFVLGGSIALGRRVWISTRWMSATSIAGPSFKADTVQLDLNGKF